MRVVEVDRPYTSPVKRSRNVYAHKWKLDWYRRKMMRRGTLLEDVPEIVDLLTSPSVGYFVHHDGRFGIGLGKKSCCV